MKTSKQLERYFKGSANHWRIEIILLIEKRSGLTVEQIADTLNGNFKTISQHTHQLVRAGLLNKQYRGRQVIHTLSPYGELFSKFMRRF